MKLRIIAFCLFITFQVQANGPVFKAIENGDINHVTTYLNNNGSVEEATNKSGLTLLCAAALHKQTDIAQLLLEHGANVNKKTNDGLTPIHIATCHQPCLQMVEILVKHKANLEKRWYGKTALHFAVQTHSPKIAEYLLKNGANKNAQCLRTGETALHIATTRGWHYKKMVPILLNYGVNKFRRNKKKQTALKAGLEKHILSADDKRQLKELLLF